MIIWVIKIFLYRSSKYSRHFFLISSASVRSIPFFVLCCAHLCMKCSLGISTFKRSLVFAWRRQWQPTPILLPGKSHGWRSLVGCSPWAPEQLDTTERLHFHFSLSCIREGNGNPLQCSCLENPRVSRAWWAAIYGVAQSQTQPKWLSSSSSLSHSIVFLYFFALITKEG